MHFLKHLLRFSSRCFSSLGLLLLSSMSLKISASSFGKSSLTFAAADVVTCISLLSFSNTLALLLAWNTIEPASSSWCGTCASRFSSVLWSGWSSPCGRCFGNRSPASTAQPPMQQLLMSTSRAPSSLMFSIGCGRCSCSRFPVVMSRSLSLFSSSLPQSVDVHPSWRPCSDWAGTHHVVYCCAAAFHVSSSNACGLLLLLRRFLLCPVFLLYFLCHVLQFLLWRRHFFLSVNDFLWYLSANSDISTLVFFPNWPCSTYPIV